MSQVSDNQMMFKVLGSAVKNARHWKTMFVRLANRKV